VYESEQPNLGYFLQWFDYLRYAVPTAGLRQRERMYRWRSLSARESKYEKAGKWRNHLERLSLISTFRQKLDDIHL
jgi:hypothetical protein